VKRLAPLLLLFAACGEDHAKVPAPPPPGTALVLSAHVVSNLSDAAIVGVMVSFFEGEIEQAKIAHDRAQDPRVGAFADEVRIDDAAALDRMQNLARNLDLDPTKTSALRQHIDIENENALLRLTAASGDDFDTLYVDLLAKQGIEVIKIIDDQLMPAAKDPALRAELEMARALIAHHVMQAKDLLR
jgi:predicted outer membrane protein